LDVEMPRMDGLEFLQKLMRARPMPVVMCSSSTEQGCDTTLRALELGAVDFVAKPRMDIARGFDAIAVDLVSKVKAAARARPSAKRLSGAPRRDAPPTGPAPRTADVVFAIGASTGGTQALLEVLRALPADSPGVVVVQHMPEHFTRSFADRLDQACTVRVREASDGDRVLPGLVLIAPGGARHMQVARFGGHVAVRLVAGNPVNHHRPSVDVLFDSCARELGPRAVGAILTGMGADGAEGLRAMRTAGARTVAQDEETSVVFGMPKEAIRRGAAERVVPLGAVADIMRSMAGTSP
jgi:two-component system chemotaxis response regulator CheB